MSLIQLGGGNTPQQTFVSWKDPDGDPLVSINRDGTVTTQGITYGDGTKQTTASSGGGAPLNSPAFTGTPTAPTAAPLTNNTQLATTAYTDLAVAANLAKSINSTGGLGGFYSHGVFSIFGTAVSSNPMGGAAATNFAANNVIALMFVLQSSITINRASFQWTSADSSHTGFGIYNSVGTKVFETGVVTEPHTTGVVSQTTFTGVVLTPGVYYFASTCSVTSAATCSMENLPLSGLSGMGSPILFLATNSSSGTSGSPFLPATLGALTPFTVGQAASASMPCVYWDHN